MRFAICLAAIFWAAGCGPKDTIPGGNHPANPGAPTALPAPAAAPAGDERQAIADAERAALERAQPVFAKYCAGCHTSGGAKTSKEALEHFSMDGYPFGGHHATEVGTVVRAALGAEGQKPTMPENDPGAVKGDELAAVVEWTEAFDRSHAAGLHDHGGHGEHGGHSEHGGHGDDHGRGHHHGHGGH